MATVLKKVKGYSHIQAVRIKSHCEENWGRRCDWKKEITRCYTTTWSPVLPPRVQLYGGTESAQSKSRWMWQMSVFSLFFLSAFPPDFEVLFLRNCRRRPIFFFFFRVNVVAVCLPETHPVEIARQSQRYVCQLA